MNGFFDRQQSTAGILERIKGFPSWIEIDLDLLDLNLKEISEWVSVELIPCVKTNAYGHGLVPIVAHMIRRGVKRFLVAKLWEALQIRDAGLDCAVINMDPLYTVEQYDVVVENCINQTVFSRCSAERLSRAAVNRAKKVKVWVKVDTGLGRVGVRHEVALDFIKDISSLPNLEIDGIFSTLAEDREFDKIQLERLLNVDKGLRQQGIQIQCRSLASSNAVFHFPNSYLDAVRPGLMIYGLYPEPKDRGIGLELRPVMSFKARLEHVKWIEAGDSVTYSRRFVAPRRMKVGTVHAGYSDGVPRGLTNMGLVMVGGEVRPMLGAVSVNHHVVDVDGLDVDAGDVVEVVSRNGNNTLERLSELAGIMPYSFCVGLNPLTPRVYVQRGRPVALSEPRLVP